MSLRDTIQGAREEVGANGVLSRKDKEEKPAEDAEKDEGERGGFSKRSVSRAKPAREAAAGVRVVDASGRTKSKKGTSEPKTKEEKKAERRREQELNDKRFTVSDAILNQNPDYLKYRRTWWILLGTGFAALILTFVTNIADPAAAADVRTNLGLASLILIVFSYVAIIAGFIYDFRKIRPLRKQADAAAAGMSLKKLNGTVDDLRRKKMAEEAARSSQKAAKRSKSRFGKKQATGADAADEAEKDAKSDKAKK
ncbi:hypothetical protein ACTM8Z_04990 [Atopobiaceae bacterium HCP3S3_D6]